MSGSHRSFLTCEKYAHPFKVISAQNTFEGFHTKPIPAPTHQRLYFFFFSLPS